MRSLVIDQTSPLPASVQIKEQIKVAYTFGRLRQGDILPSTRTLARQLGVGEAAVRRAYKELVSLGFLTSERRKHVMVNYKLTAPPHLGSVAAESAEVCDRTISWAKSKGLSSISLSRLLLQRAIAHESASPSYVYVDASTTSATQFAEIIARAWEIKVQGLSLEDFGKLSSGEIERFTAILVNFYRYDRLLEIARHATKRVHPVRIKLKDQIVRKMRRLPAGSAILLVFPDEDFGPLWRSVVDSHCELVGSKWRFEALALGEIRDLVALAKAGKYQLIIVSVHIWDQIPETARRLPMVIPNQNEPDMGSLEEVRVRSGVLV